MRFAFSKVLTSLLMVGTLTASAAAQSVAPISTIYNSTPIPIPTLGPGSLYPSTIGIGTEVVGLDLASRMVVTIHNFSHTFPDDVTLILEQQIFPFHKVVLMSNCGGSTDVTNLTLTFDSAAPTSLPDTAALTSGTFRSTSYGVVPVLPAPAPVGPYESLSALNGIFPINGWRLYAYDSASPDGGSIEGWSIAVHSDPAGSIGVQEDDSLIPVLGKASVYPSVIQVHDVAGPIATVSLRIYLQHDYPNDIDMLLVAPDGRSCVIMSDVGGMAPVTANFVTIIDTSAASIPSPIVSNGTYRPTNVGVGDVFPAPAPPGPHGATLADLAGGTPNGTWRMFVNDDQAPDGGTLSRWELFVNGKQFCSGDFNKNGSVTPQDVFDFLAAFFAPCL